MTLSTRRVSRATARRATARRAVGLVALLIGEWLTIGWLAGCATSPPPGRHTLTVVAAENIWGDLARQLAGTRGSVTSVIASPAVDPHDYEPTVADARAIATARLVIINGAGYDSWAGVLRSANPAEGRIVLTVARLVGVPAGGNPHRWYAPDDVRAVVDQIAADLARLDPAGADYFQQRHDQLIRVGLAEYFQAIDQIRTRYAGTPIGASESIVALLAEATGLHLITPAGMLRAISEGTEPSAADKGTVDAQIRHRQIAVYLENRQNATSDVRAQVAAARAAHIPVVTITETPTPAGVSFQDWQVRQLTDLSRALAQATGR